MVVGGTLTGFRWVEDLYARFWVEGVAVVRALRRGGRDGTVKTGDWAGTSSALKFWAADLAGRPETCCRVRGAFPFHAKSKRNHNKGSLARTPFPTIPIAPCNQTPSCY